MTNPSHYREIEEIGRGGMAAVYKAAQTATKVEVALKRPMPWDGCNDRLRREADSLASIDHPHVIPVLDTGTDNARQHWYTMPIAVGSLGKFWATGFLGSDPEALCSVMLDEVCSGIGVIQHERNNLARVDLNEKENALLELLRSPEVYVEAGWDTLVAKVRPSTASTTPSTSPPFSGHGWATHPLPARSSPSAPSTTSSSAPPTSS